MIDPRSVKDFWEARGQQVGKTAFESIANLEPDPALLAKKISDEMSCVMPKLALNPDMRVLDLGAGVGQWTVRFAPLVREVVAVEYAAALVSIGENALKEQKVLNARFIECAAEQFTSDEPFDVVFISGLFVYLTDEQVDRLFVNLPTLVRPGGSLCLRDGTSILPNRHVIRDRWSEVLRANYSAIYRTRDEYVKMFENHGFTLQEDCQVFKEGNPLNKYDETRLRLYIFARQT